MKSIKNEDTVRVELYNLFQLFMDNKIDNAKFTDNIQAICRGKNYKSYWWRFFPGDTGANDWSSVRSSLLSEKNTEYLKECIEIALTERQMIVIYS